MPTRPPTRTLTPADAAAYVALRREMLEDSPWAFSSSPADDVGLDSAFIAARLVEPNQAIIGAFDGARLIGAAGLHRDRHLKMAHRARVWGVYVTPSARARGIGSAILTHIFALARTWPGITSLGLSASERSEAARRLYERHGFRAWGREPACLAIDGRIYDEIHMIAFLDSTQPGTPATARIA